MLLIVKYDILYSVKNMEELVENLGAIALLSDIN